MNGITSILYKCIPGDLFFSLNLRLLNGTGVQNMAGHWMGQGPSLSPERALLGVCGFVCVENAGRRQASQATVHGAPRGEFQTGPGYRISWRMPGARDLNKFPGPRVVSSLARSSFTRDVTTQQARPWLGCAAADAPFGLTRQSRHLPRSPLHLPSKETVLQPSFFS